MLRHRYIILAKGTEHLDEQVMHQSQKFRKIRTRILLGFCVQNVFLEKICSF